MEDLICIYQISSKSIYKRRTDASAFDTDFSGYDRVIDTHIKNLRKKIEDDPKIPFICVQFMELDTSSGEIYNET